MTNHNQLPTLKWPGLLKGTLLKRYKRFMADIKLRNGHVVTAHCPNSGSMKTCCEAGRPVYLSRSSNPNRRLKYTWEMIEMPTSLVGVNTSIPNRLVKESALRGLLESLSGYELVRSEVKYGTNSRIDVLLENPGSDRCFIEVKNSTLMENGVAYFPDAVTARGLKHLVELQEMVRSGDRAVMFFLIQRMDCGVFRPADHIDPAYGKELRKAVQNGVEIMAHDVSVDLRGISIRSSVRWEL